MRYIVMATMAAALALGGCDALSGSGEAASADAAAKGDAAGSAAEGGDAPAAAASDLDPVLANPAVGDV